MKIGCIIQGDIRRGTNLVLECVPKLFDYSVLSTWASANIIAPEGDFEVLLNQKPMVRGFSNRNYQRYSTARGLDAAKAAGCDYVLKWRTDLLPTKLSINALLELAQFSPPKHTKSRIVTPAFRNLSVEPDCLSSMPDLFAFGHIDEMEKLWGDKGFDYSKDFNLPLHERDTLGHDLLNSKDFPSLYPPESELYSLYRERLNATESSRFTHKTIAENYCRLINYRDLGILWFGPQQGFRPIGAAWEHPWWTEKQWLKKSAKVQPYGYPFTGLTDKIRRKISRHKVRQEIREQQKIWEQNFPPNSIF